MNTILTKLQETWTRERPGEARVVAVHEDFSTGARVNEFCHSLATDLRGQCGIVRQMWLVNLIRLPRLRAITAEEAACADLIIVSLHDAASFPTELKDWLELWLQRKGERPEAVLGLYDRYPPRTSSSLHAYLNAVARRGGMSFFSLTFEAAED